MKVTYVLIARTSLPTRKDFDPTPTTTFSREGYYGNMLIAGMRLRERSSIVSTTNWNRNAQWYRNFNHVGVHN
jgi:hypothetical protein